MRSKVTRLIKTLLWKISKRDYILLNPQWLRVEEAETDRVTFKKPSDKKFLSVRYNYHTDEHWRLNYEIRGRNGGELRYTLRAPNGEPFCEVKLNIQLPFTWTVELLEQGIIGNGSCIPPLPGGAIPRNTPWLVGELEFCSAEDGTLYRRTGHRVRLNGRVSDESYFNGAVYNSYDDEASCFPKEILDAVERYQPLEGEFLDVGCATGLLVEYATTKGLNAEGVDTSAWAIEKAKSRTHGRCRTLDFDHACQTDFPCSYDIVTMHSVIEHLADPTRALNLLYNICKPNGVVYIQTLNADSLMHLILRQDWGGYTDYTHKSPWITSDWITKTASRVGFEIVSVKRYHVWNDNIYDEVWRSFSTFAQVYPANVILEDQFGDAVEVILRRPRNTL